MPVTNSDFSRDFMAGASVARMAQQRQERMIELRAQAALQQLQERQIAQEMDIKAQNFMRQQQDDQYIRAKFAAADEMHATLAPEIGSDAAKEFIDNALSYDPIAGPILMKAREAESQMRMNQAHAKVYEADAKASGMPFNENFKPVPIKDENGKIISYVVPGKTPHFIAPEKGTELERNAETLATKKQELEDLNLSLMESGVGENDPDTTEKRRKIAKLETEVSSIAAKMKGLQGSITMTPEGGLQVNLGEGSATVGTQTQIQTDLAGIQSSIVQIERAKNDLTEKDLGVSGNIWEFANKWLAQVAPEVADAAVSGDRVQMQKAVDSYLSSMQSRGRLSAAERADIRKMLVTGKLGESLPRAKAILEKMSLIQKTDAIAKAKAGQQPLAEWMFKGLSDTDIRNLYKDGTLTKPEARAWLMKHR